MKKQIGAFGLGLAAGAAGGFVAGAKEKDELIHKSSTDADKYKRYYNLMNNWLKLKNEKKSLSAYFEKKGMKNIAIYGMGDLGRRFFEEINHGGVSVAYGIDRNARNLCAEFPLYRMDDEFSKADAIVVTSTYYFDEIYNQLRNVKKVSCPVISLEDIIYELL